MAILEGISPASIVNTTLMITNMMPVCQGRYAVKVGMSVTFLTMALTGMHSNLVNSTPNRPLHKPMMKVSALNTLPT